MKGRLRASTAMNVVVYEGRAKGLHRWHLQVMMQSKSA